MCTSGMLGSGQLLCTNMRIGYLSTDLAISSQTRINFLQKVVVILLAETSHVCRRYGGMEFVPESELVLAVWCGLWGDNVLLRNKRPIRNLSHLVDSAGAGAVIRKGAARVHLAEESCVGRRYAPTLCASRGELDMIRKDALMLDLEFDICYLALFPRFPVVLALECCSCLSRSDFPSGKGFLRLGDVSVRLFEFFP